MYSTRQHKTWNVLRNNGCPVAWGAEMSCVQLSPLRCLCRGFESNIRACFASMFACGLLQSDKCLRYVSCWAVFTHQFEICSLTSRFKHIHDHSLNTVRILWHVRSFCYKITICYIDWCFLPSDRQWQMRRFGFHTIVTMFNTSVWMGSRHKAQVVELDYSIHVWLYHPTICILALYEGHRWFT